MKVSPHPIKAAAATTKATTTIIRTMKIAISLFFFSCFMQIETRYHWCDISLFVKEKGPRCPALKRPCNAAPGAAKRNAVRMLVHAPLRGGEIKLS